jgi:catalase
VFDSAFADAQPYDVLDSTKLIPEEDIPVRIIGRMVLDRNPDNFFAETEQVAFCPANIVPGIDFSNDPLLQGRLFSYLDTQKSRLGTSNFHQIPINAPKCPVMNFQRDGQMQMHVPVGRATYEPNSLAEHGEPAGLRECPRTGFVTSPAVVGPNEEGAKVRARDARFADHYSQARLYWRSLTGSEQSHIASSFAFELSKVALESVPPRVVAGLRNVDEGVAGRVAKALGIALPEALPAARVPIDMKPSPALSIQKNMKPGLEGKSVGILITDGSDGTVLDALVAAIEQARGRAVIVAPRVGNVKLADGSTRRADGQLLGTPSHLFDAIALVLSDTGTQQLLKYGDADRFVMDAYAHLKAIGVTPAAHYLLLRARVDFDDGITGVGAEFIEAAGRRLFTREPLVRMLA